MKVLVTGSSGKLGSITVRHLRDAGHDVSGVDLEAGPATDIIADIEDPWMFGITENMDAVIHTAALHGRHMDLNYPREAFISTNIKGTLNLLNACVANKVKKFLFTSSTSVYGRSLHDSNKAVWVDENLPVQPRDIYDITKQACEELCRDFFDKESLQASVYRVGRFLPEPENLMLNHRLYRGLDERDGAHAFALALEQEFEQFEIFNISSGSPFQPADVTALKTDAASVIRRYYPNAVKEYERKGWQLPDTIDRVYCSDKAKRVFNYQPRYTFEHLLAQY